MSTKENKLRKYIKCKEKHKQKIKSQFPKLYQEYLKVSVKKSSNLRSSMVSKNNLQFFLERYSKSNPNKKKTLRKIDQSFRKFRAQTKRENKGSLKIKPITSKDRQVQKQWSQKINTGHNCVLKINTQIKKKN